MKISNTWLWQEAQGFPWPGLSRYGFSEPLVLDSGESLDGAELAYETWGAPDKPPVLVFHALTGDSHVASHRSSELPGWWERVAGEGLGLDTRTHFVLSANVLGGTMGSTGPSSLAPDGDPYGSRFPPLTLFDMARATERLVRATIPGHHRLRLIGGSMGGMIAMAYASLFPEQVESLLAVGAPVRHSPWAIAFHTVGRESIRHDHYFWGGDYYAHEKGPQEGLSVARMTDMISYQSPASMEEKFGRQWQNDDQDLFQISSYLRYQGQKLTRRFDANTYLALTEAMDRFELSQAQMSRLAGIPLWMVGMATDVLYPPDEIARQSEELRRAGALAEYRLLGGPWGHDTFLVDQRQTGALVQEFLAVRRS